MGASLQSPTYAIVTELVARGSLWDVLREEGAEAAGDDGDRHKTGVGGSKSWSWERLHRVAHGIVCGMAYLHGHCPPILHRDLKSSNLLCDEAYTVKVSLGNLPQIIYHSHASARNHKHASATL